MKTENGKVEGDLLVSEDLNMNGMVTGNITVSNGASLKLNGMCLNNVIVEKSSHAEINGMINGDLINNGGSLDVHGSINGDINSFSGESNVSHSAHVAGQLSIAKDDSHRIYNNLSNPALLSSTVGAAVVGNILLPGVGALAGAAFGALIGYTASALGTDAANDELSATSTEVNGNDR